MATTRARRDAALNAGIAPASEYGDWRQACEAEQRRRHALHFFPHWVWVKVQRRAKADGRTPEDFVLQSVEQALQA